jgi:predicted transcriptional regulator
MARPTLDIDRQQTGFRLRVDIIKAVRHLAVDTGKPVNVVIEEALIAFLQARDPEIFLTRNDKKK